MKAPRLTFLGTSEQSNSDLVESAEEAGGGGLSWLWRRFVVEKGQDAKAAPMLSDCEDGNGRVVKKSRKGSSVECEKQNGLVQKMNATATAHGQGGGLPRDSRFQRGVPIRPSDAAREVEELRGASLRRDQRAEQSRFPTRDGNVEEESGALRQRRGSMDSRFPARVGNEKMEDLRGSRERRGGVESRLSGRDGGEMEDLRDARERRGRVESRFPADRDGSEMEDLRGARERRGRVDSRFPADRDGSGIEDLRDARERRGRVDSRFPADRDGSEMEDLLDARERRGGVDSRFPADRDESGIEDLRDARERRGRVDSRFPARDGSEMEDLRDARERRVRAGQRAADPIDAEAARKHSIPLRWRGSVQESLERDSFRFRVGREGYGDRLRGDVKEQAPKVAQNVSALIAPSASIRASARVSPEDTWEDASKDVSEDDSEDVTEDDLEDLSENLGVAPITRSEMSDTSLEVLEALLKNSTELEKLKKVKNATAPVALFGARNGTLRDALTANVSDVNATQGTQFGTRNATLGEALMANVSGINATLGELFEAYNASHSGVVIAANVSGVNVTLGELFGAYNASLSSVVIAANVSGVNVTLGELFGAYNASLSGVVVAANVSGVNVTLGEFFGAYNASLRDAVRANGSGVNPTLGELFGAGNASLGDVITANVSGINGTLGELVGARNTSLGAALTVNVSDIRVTLDAQHEAQNASLGDARTANVSDIRVSLDAQLKAQNASSRDAVKANVSDIQNATCLRGLIYVYTLPKKFNTELLENCSSLLQWGDRCRELSNFGLGPSLDEWPLSDSQNYSQKQGSYSRGPWYGTDQFNGEVIFHQRLLAHPCRTNNPELAKAFYIPYYAGLDIARFLFNVTGKQFRAEDRDKLGGELVEWMAQSPYWKRHQGVDHFLMLGRITWDFRRKGDRGWGSSLINMPEMANVTKLALERSPWDNMEMAIPYPTAFHPRDDDEVVEWQNALRNVRRDLLFSFAGAPRKEFPNDFRIELFEQCKRANNSCEALDCLKRKCEDDPLAATRLFTRYIKVSFSRF